MSNYFEAEIKYKCGQRASFETIFLVCNPQASSLYIYEHREHLRHEKPEQTLSLGQHQYIVQPCTDHVVLILNSTQHMFQFDSTHVMQQFIDILDSSSITKTTKKPSHVPFRMNPFRLPDQTSMIQLTVTEFTKQPTEEERDAADEDDLITEYLQRACDIYWNEANHQTEIDDEEADEYSWLDELRTNKKHHKRKHKKSPYLNDDDFAAMKWPFYFEYVIKKSRNWSSIYTDCQKIFSLKKYDNQYHKNDILSQNQILDFLWIYIGFCCWKAKQEEFTLGDVGMMVDFLGKLNHLFKYIIIAYDFEITYYGKILNHCMKTYLKNINNELLYRAQQIYQRKIVPNKQWRKCAMYDPLKAEYDLLRFRINACKLQLQENGIVVQKM
eukprot:115521_1